MKKQIKELTDHQKSQMKPWADKWIKIGLRTGDTDWETFEKYIPVCYEKAGLKFPNKIIRVQSPIVGAFASSIAGKILNGDAVDGAVGDAVYDAVGDAVGDAVRDAVDGAVGDAVRDAVGDAVGDAVRDAVYDAVGGAVRGAKLKWHYWFGGQFWVGSYWLGSPSFVSFFTDVCGLKLSKDIQERETAYRKICESVNYFWTNKDFVIVCSRPNVINLNDRGQLHCETGKAVEYPDGWGLYMLNGIRVPEWLVGTPAEKIDTKKALEEKNVDVQREIIRKMGADRLIKEMEELDEYKDKKTNLVYKLMKLKIGGSIDRKYLYYKHASINDIFYCQPIPPETEKALHGYGWMRKLVEREELNNIDVAKEAEIIANLPAVVS